MTTWIHSVAGEILGWVLAGVGLFLVIVGVIYMAMALKGKTKEWGNFVQNFFVGLVGGLMLAWAATSLLLVA